MVKWLNCYKTTKIFLFLTVLLAPLYVVRFRIGPYPSTLLEVLVGLTLLSWAVGKARQWRVATSIDLRFTIYDLPIVLFLIAAAISVIVSPDKRGGLGIFKAYFVEPVLVFLVIKDVVRSKRDWWLALGALGLSGLWVALLAVFQATTGWLTFAPHEAALGRAHAVYNTANAVGLYIGPIVMLLLGVLLSAKEKFKVQSSKFKILEPKARRLDRTVQSSKLKFFLLFTVYCLLFAILLSKSTGAMVGLLGGLGVLGVLGFLGVRRGIRVTGVVGVVLLLAGIWFFFNVSDFTPPKNIDPYVRKSTDTLQFRLCLWEGTRNLLLDRPLFGAGLSGFKELYSQKYFTCDAEPLEYPHNWVLNFWAEMGILGLLGFLGVLGVYFERVKRVEMVKRGMGVAFAAAMVYWLVHGLVDVPYFKNDLSLEFWVIVGLAETLGLTF